MVSGVERLTGSERTVGTVAYMSPEQALGKELDARSDIFSFGIVLYEMATGVPPFRGETAAAIFDELLHKETPAPSRGTGDLPEDLARIIGKALEKDRALRYQNAADLQADLQRVKSDRDSRRTAAPAAGKSAHIRSLG